MYAGDFNSHHTDWVYNADGGPLITWASKDVTTLLYDPKEALHLLLCMLEQPRFNFWEQPVTSSETSLTCFPGSHHRLYLITIPSVIQLVQGRDVKTWNFWKYDWEGLTKQMHRAAAGLAPRAPTSSTVPTSRTARWSWLLPKRASPVASAKPLSWQGMWKFTVPTQKQKTPKVGTKQQMSSSAS